MPGRCRAAPASTRAAPGRSADCGRPRRDLKQEGKEKGLRREWVLRGAFSLAVDQVGLAGLLTVMGPRTSRRRSQTAKLAHCGAPTRGRKNARKHRETGLAEDASIKYVNTEGRRGVAQKQT